MRGRNKRKKERWVGRDDPKSKKKKTECERKREGERERERSEKKDAARA